MIFIELFSLKNINVYITTLIEDIDRLEFLKTYTYYQKY